MKILIDFILGLFKLIIQTVLAAAILLGMLAGYLYYAEAQQVSYFQNQFPGLDKTQAKLLVNGQYNACIKNPLSGDWTCAKDDSVMDGYTMMYTLSGATRVNLNR